SRLRRSDSSCAGGTPSASAHWPPNAYGCTCCCCGYASCKQVSASTTGRAASARRMVRRCSRTFSWAWSRALTVTSTTWAVVWDLGQGLARVVTGSIQAARVEERQQRRLGGRELVLPREARAGAEAVADLRLAGAGQELDDRRLAALRLAEQPEHRHGRTLPQFLQPLLQPGLPFGGGEPAFEGLEHGSSIIGTGANWLSAAGQAAHEPEASAKEGQTSLTLRVRVVPAPRSFVRQRLCWGANSGAGMGQPGEMLSVPLSR